MVGGNTNPAGNACRGGEGSIVLLMCYVIPDTVCLGISHAVTQAVHGQQPMIPLLGIKPRYPLLILEQRESCSIFDHQERQKDTGKQLDTRGYNCVEIRFNTSTR